MNSQVKSQRPLASALSLARSPCREAVVASCFSWIPRGNSSRLILTKAIVNSTRAGSEANGSFVFTGRPCCILVIILMRCRNARDCNASLQRAFDARIKGAGISALAKEEKILEICFCVLYAYEESVGDSEAARVIHSLEISRSFSQSVVEITFYVASSFHLFYDTCTSITFL